MSDNYMDDYANRYRQESADAPFGSIASWNAHFSANAAQQQADFIRADEARRADAARSASSSPFPIYTPTTYAPSGGGAWSGGSRTRSPPGPFAQALGKFIVWTFKAVVLLGLVVAALFYGARWADLQWLARAPDGGAARYALARVVPDARLQLVAIPSTHPSGVSKMPTASELAAALARPRTSAMQAQRLLASAYACQMDVPCRGDAARDVSTEALVRHAATDHLLERVGAGDADAVDGACFLSMSTRTATVSAREARYACFQALRIAERTKKPDVLRRAEHDTQLFRDNPWFIAAYAMDRSVPLL